MIEQITTNRIEDSIPCYEKVELEYSIYDTNVSHDKSWIMGESVIKD